MSNGGLHALLFRDGGATCRDERRNECGTAVPHGLTRRAKNSDPMTKFHFETEKWCPKLLTGRVTLRAVPLKV